METYPALFFYDQAVIVPLKYLFWVCVFLTQVGAVSIHAAPQGFVEGHLQILSQRPVALADENTETATVGKNYSDYPLVVLSRDERKQIARITADADGNYRTALPPGDYILDVQERVPKRLHVSAQPFTVVPNQTVRVDMRIVTGFADEGTRSQE